MYGYASRKTESEGVAGRLKASALVIGDDTGDGPVVLLAVDSGSVPPRLQAEVFRRLSEKTGLRRERFMLCNSHTHSGPNIKGADSLEGEQREHIDQYAALLTDRLERVVLDAFAARVEARLDRTQGQVDVAANRRVLTDGKWSGFGAVADGAVDHSLPLLRVTDTRGKLLAVLLNYACHNTTLRGNFMRIHGDWAGCAQEYIEADHPGCVALITIGCGADSDPCPHGTVELCQQHGRAMADEVTRLLAGPFEPVDVKITARYVPLTIAHGEAASRQELKYGVGVWTFGDDLAMIFLAHEVVVDYAARMKRELNGARLWINAYSNEVAGYVVSSRLIEEGGYETRSSLSSRLTSGHPELLQPPMEDRIIGHVRELLPEGFRAPPGGPSSR